MSTARTGDTFLWGAATSAHQTEGDNRNSDWWALEQALTPFIELSGDGVDSYHRFREDMSLLAGAGLNTYRFSIEWARIEPEPGRFSSAELAHYRDMVQFARSVGLTPMVTLHHFTVPLWFEARGGWLAPDSHQLFARYCKAASAILGDVPWLSTINEPNVLAVMPGLRAMMMQSPEFTADRRPPLPDLELGARLLAAHEAGREVLRRETDAQLGWTVACQAFTPTSGNEAVFERVKHTWEDFFLAASRDDDYVGVQSYTSQPVDHVGPVLHPTSPTNTLTGWAYRPDALGIAVRQAAAACPGVPIVVTENGIATRHDTVRIEYTEMALHGLYSAMRDGVDVRGYIHWSALDNYEWGHWGPTFGLIEVDRTTFARSPRPSLQWLGQEADRGPLAAPGGHATGDDTATTTDRLATGLTGRTRTQGAGDGAQFPYQDSSLALEQRTDDLLSRMTLADKAGLMFQPTGQVGHLDDPGMGGAPSMREFLDRRITHANILGASSAREVAEWHNAVQQSAERIGLGIPFTVSSDPRHHFTDNPMTALIAGPFSQWPETLGFGALDDPDLVARFADTVRREYLAVGIRVGLHPQVDLATDPRWARALTTFGSDPGVVGRLGAAYIRGLQGDRVGSDSVAAMVKHFPGGGPQLDGEDPHFDYGREQVYPGGRFAEHLQPFIDAFAAGAGQVMPYYGMPVGTEYEEVGFGFNKQIITGLLREQLGFDGIVCSDWGILHRICWGVEDLTVDERILKALDAGVDQFGGEYCPDALVTLVKAGKLPEARLDVSARRLLLEKFRLGLFDDRRYVDIDAADSLVGTSEARAAGLDAQAASQVLLTNDAGSARLPLSGQPRLYVEGADPEAFAGWAHVVATPADADLAVIRTVAPWEERGTGGDIESFFHAGSLEFHDDQLAHLREIAAIVPTIVDVYLDRPAILAPVAEIASSVLVNFGASTEAFVRVLFGESAPQGRLPFEIPSSMAAVQASRPDVANDTADPTFGYGDGLRYENWSPATRPITATEIHTVILSSRYDLTKTQLRVILDDPDARAVIDEFIPALPKHPMISVAKGMPVDVVLGLAAKQAPEEVVAEVRTRLAALPPRDPATTPDAPARQRRGPLSLFRRRGSAAATK